MKRLKLSFFGPPEIYYDNQLLAFRTRKALALLIYLATEAGQHPREKLTALFWPESDTGRGRGMLRTSLFHLREAIDTFGGAYLIVERQGLGFDATLDVDFDLHLLQEAMNTLERAANQKAGDQFIGQLQRAVDRYRGDFLEGFTLPDTPTFDDWASLQREFWHGRVSRLFETLSQGYFERGDLANGLETATRWQGHDPFSEAAASRLMQLYFANNNRTAALQTYADYQTMLVDEFGAVPSPEIEALAARIRTSAAPQRLPNPPTPARAPADLTFVGRTHEFHRLRAIFNQTSRGQVQVALLAGEAGIGKTRLATEFLTWATAQGADILSGRAFEAGGRLPYQPLVQCLRSRLARENAPDDLLSDIWLAELSRLLPELRDRYPDLAQPQPDEATAQTRLFEAITRLGQVLARRAPLLLFLDDAQWADLASLDALQFALSRWNETRTPILLLLSARNEAFATTSDLQNWLARLKSDVTVTRLELHYLTRENTLALITDLQADHLKSSQPPDISDDTGPVPLKLDAFAEALHTETGGHPFFVAETLKALLEQKVLVPGQTDAGTKGLMWRTLAGETSGRFPFLRIIPTSVRQAILDRLARLTPTAKALLTSAAVLGQEATFEQLCELSAVDEMAGVEALEELVGRRLLLEREEFTPTYLIVHDLMRTVLYEETSTARKRLLHRRAMTVLAGAAPARLAYHALAAGAGEAAFQYSVAAGDAAAQLYADTEAVAFYDKALALGARSYLSVEKLTNLYLKRGRALEHLGFHDKALENYQELDAAAVERQDKPMLLAALVVIGAIRSNPTPVFDPAEAEAVAEKGLTLAQELDDLAAQAKINWNLMQMLIYRNQASDNERALAYGETALALSRQLGLQDQVAVTLNDLQSIYVALAQLEPAKAVAQEARALFREAGNLPMLAGSYVQSGFIHYILGEFDEALSLMAECQTIAESISNLHVLGGVADIRGKVHLEQGEFGRAIREMGAALQIEGMNKMRFMFTGLHYSLGCAYFEAGDLNLTMEHTAVALDAALGLPPVIRQGLLAMQAKIFLLSGDVPRAQQIFAVIGEIDPITVLSSVYIGALYLTEVEIELALGRAEAALIKIEPVIAFANQLAVKLVLSQALHLKGRILLGQGQVAEAEATFAAAQAVAAEIGHRRILWKILAARAEATEDRTAAAQLWELAQAEINFLAEHLGSAELQASFLDLPEVRAALAA
ncbi:MAG: AAA family ATPase [Anaerolineales bacterium]|nr:AAA family ATPase [Anaerolineales bacterium]